MIDTHALGDQLAMGNAVLNSTSAVLLFVGWRAITNRGTSPKRVLVHRGCMIGALAVSTVFLISYLSRVALTGTHAYPGHGPLKAIYLAVLGSHMLLAMATPPLALRALYLALRRRFPEHRRIVRFAFPIWMYVSVTGVVVYLMLYHAPH